MANNIFEELQMRKEKLAVLAQKAYEYGWIDKEHEAGIIQKLENDVLTIGVIGQMKCGKSTFLNSFVFEDDVLPAATTPMTAALSVITYGPEKKIEAEFYSADEWEEQKLNAQRNLEDVQGNELEESKIKAAQELMSKSVKLGSDIHSYLGGKKEDAFENLIEYVGADGKYVSITKSVKIYYPKEYLKGVEIVDTPGFNDPIVSREERTRAFLKKADVVLLMLYAGRPFDASDRAILFKHVAQSGMGKVLVGINKYDIPYEKGETEEEISKYVQDEIYRACNSANNDSLKEILKETTPISLSAEMALLSSLSMQKINQTDAYNHAWNRLCRIFEITSQGQMRQKSHIEHLITAVREVIEREKSEILFRKPINSINAAGNSKRAVIDRSIREIVNMLEVLKMPDDELEEKENRLNKLNRRLNKKIDILCNELTLTVEDIVRDGKYELEDIVDICCKKMCTHVDDWKRFASAEKLNIKLENELNILQNRSLKRSADKIEKEAKRKIKECVSTALMDIEELLLNHPVYEDFDPTKFVSDIQRELEFKIEDKPLFNNEDADDGSLFAVLGNFIYELIKDFTLGIGTKLIQVLTHNANANEYKQNINNLSRDFNADEPLSHIINSKDQIIELVKTKFLDEFITPLIEQLDEIKNLRTNKEDKIKDEEFRLNEFEQQKDAIDAQINEMAVFVQSI